jgi:formylmethanofuran dehydrogenase subunit E
LQKQIAASAFMEQRAAGVSPDEISEEDQMELVDLVWNAPESDILTVGPVFEYPYNWLPEVMGFAKCDQCGELVAHAYRRIVGDKIMCIPCSGYDR